MNTNATIRSTADYQQIDAAHHIHAFLDQKQLNAEGPRVITKGEGVYVWDNDGNKYLDGMSGLWCTAVGYGHPKLVEAATSQMTELSYYNMFFHTTHPRVIELSEILFEKMGPSFSHVVYTNSGSESNEALIRTVRRFWEIEGKPEKNVIIGRWNGYHGSTVGSASLGGMKFMHQMGGLPIPDVAHVDEPYWYANGGETTPEEFGLQAAASLEAKIIEFGADRVAAFIAEPFQGAGGMIFPPTNYWKEIQRICRKYDVLICADEVISGFGRLGTWFGYEHFDFQPDTVSLAKGLTSGYIPMGGLVLSKRIGQALVNQGGIYAHGLTYSGHPVAAAVAIANLKVLSEEGLVDNAGSEAGPYLQSSLRDTFGDHPLVGDIQGAGMVAALQFAQDKPSRTRFEKEADIAFRCRTIGFEHGLISRATQGRIIVAPPLIMTKANVDELVSKLKFAIDKTASEIGLL